MSSIFALLFTTSLILLLVGLVKPQSVVRWGKKKNITEVLKYYGGATLVFFILFGVFAPAVNNKEPNASVNEAEQTNASEQDIDNKTIQNEISSDEAVSQNLDAEAEYTRDSTYFPVVYIVDGDTLDVEINGVKERVRLIGINSAEFNQNNCEAQYSKDKISEMVSNKKVRLERDPLNDDKDVYGRFLRHLYLENGNFINLIMVEMGYAPGYYKYPFSFSDDFDHAEALAKVSKIGIWKEGFCQTAINTNTAPAVLNQNINTQLTNTNTNTNCVIKGNINSKGEKIYHVPGCQSYSQTIITESKGERWFCTEAEALAAGWRKALNCPK